jgi:hypothetical protein
MTEMLRYLWNVVILVFLLRAILTGYLRRRPYWSSASWWQFAKACLWPILAASICLGMSAAVDHGIYSAVGAGSAFRAAWTAIALVALIVAAWGLGSALHLLNQGDPSKPFSRPLSRF